MAQGLLEGGQKRGFVARLGEDDAVGRQAGLPARAGFP
jgi:hypothetical protein